MGFPVRRSARWDKRRGFLGRSPQALASARLLPWERREYLLVHWRPELASFCRLGPCGLAIFP